MCIYPLANFVDFGSATSLKSGMEISRHSPILVVVFVFHPLCLTRPQLSFLGDVEVEENVSKQETL